jgi:hypothetical protein
LSDVEIGHPYFIALQLRQLDVAFRVEIGCRFQPLIGPHDLQKYVEGDFLKKIDKSNFPVIEFPVVKFRQRQLTSLFSSTADILFIYKDMETFVSSPGVEKGERKSENK